MNMQAYDSLVQVLLVQNKREKAM